MDTPALGATDPGPQTIFLSYSHSDIGWKNKLLAHLAIAEGEGLLAVWDDGQIGAGADWLQKIQEAIEGARVAVFLISVDFLKSRFIRSTEVPQFLERRVTRGLQIFPVIVRSCDWQAVPWLSPLQVRPRDDKPLAGFGGDRVDAELAAIAKEIRGMLSGPAPASIVVPRAPLSRPPLPALSMSAAQAGLMDGLPSHEVAARSSDVQRPPMTQFSTPAREEQRSQNPRVSRPPQQVLVRVNLLTELKEHQALLDKYIGGYLNLVEVDGKGSELGAAIEAGWQDESLQKPDSWRQIRKLIEETSEAFAMLPEPVTSQLPEATQAVLTAISDRADEMARSDLEANVEDISREMHREVEDFSKSVRKVLWEFRRKGREELRALSQITARIFERAPQTISQGGSEARVESDSGERYQQSAAESREVQGPGDPSRASLLDRQSQQR